ncbi:MAG: polysaccharide biosynthesis tyrosine autokinase, partial [Terracidiphilus sp.]
MNNGETLGLASEKTDGLLRPNDVQQFARLHGLQGLLGIVKRRFVWIVGAIILCMIASLIITAITPRTYEATSTIELTKSSGSADSGLADMLSQQFGSDVDSLLIDQQTETAILQGDSLALAVIEKLGLDKQEESPKDHQVDTEKGKPLAESPKRRERLLDAFKSGLRIDPVRGTRLIQVSYESHNPEEAARVANTIIEMYKDQYLQSHYAATSEASAWLTKQLAELKANVEESEKKLTDFEKETGIISLDIMPTDSASNSPGSAGIHSVVIQKLDELNTELTTAEANRIEKEAIYHLVQTGDGSIIAGLESDPLAIQSKSMVLTQGGGTSALQTLQQEQYQLKINMAQASSNFGPNNRHLQEMQTQLTALNEQINQELHRITSVAQADFQLAKRTEDEIRRRFDEQQKAASQLNEKTVQFAVLSQEAYSRKKLYEDLFTRLQEANVAAGLKATNITVIDPARSQARPILPRRTANLAMGLFFGVLFGISAAFIAESLDRTARDPLEVEEITGRPVIGVIPNFHDAGSGYGSRLLHQARQLKGLPAPGQDDAATPASSAVWMLDHPDSAAAEGFRVLRTSIMLSSPGGAPKVILLTSCIPGEGKTTVTANLAVAFAQHDRKVLVIEADMRRPRLKSRLDFRGEVGLSNVLAGTCSLDSAILHGVYVPSLDVLPAGPRPPMPSEMLGSSTFTELLKSLRSRYDVIFIDSPPALLVTDPVSMSSKVNAVLWVSQAGVVTRPFLNRAAHMIERNGIPVIGFVLNRMTRKQAKY